MLTKYRIIIVLVTISFIKVFSMTEQEKAENFVQSLMLEKYDEVEIYYDSVMKVHLPKEKIKYIWEQTNSTYGEVQTLGDIRKESLSGYNTIIIPLIFKYISIDAKVVFNTDGKIAGFFMAPVQQEYVYKIPDYVDTTKFVEKEIKFGEENWKLPGIITVPNNKKNPPVVILVHGSGAHNKDEQIGPNFPFRDIAWGLSTAGIAVLRYDKRNFVYSSKMQNLDSLTMYEESIDDAILAGEFIKNYQEFTNSRIFLLGHSQGGYIIPEVNSLSNIFDGYISMAGLTNDFRETILRQHSYIFNLDNTIDELEKQSLNELEMKIKRLDSMNLNSYKNSELPLNLSQEYWKFILNYNIYEKIQKINKPILIMNGGKDYQVIESDFKNWKKHLSNNKNAEFIWYNDLNHLFMKSTNIKSEPSEYFIPGNIEKNVISDLIKWIKTND